MDKMRKKFISL